MYVYKLKEMIYNDRKDGVFGGLMQQIWHCGRWETYEVAWRSPVYRQTDRLKVTDGIDVSPRIWLERRLGLETFADLENLAVKMDPNSYVQREFPDGYNAGWLHVIVTCPEGEWRQSGSPNNDDSDAHSGRLCQKMWILDLGNPWGLKAV